MRGANQGYIKRSIDFFPGVNNEKTKEQDWKSETIKPADTSVFSEPDLNVSVHSYISINKPVIKDSTREILGKNESKTYRGHKLKPVPKYSMAQLNVIPDVPSTINNPMLELTREE